MLMRSNFGLPHIPFSFIVMFESNMMLENLNYPNYDTGTFDINLHKHLHTRNWIPKANLSHADNCWNDDKRREVELYVLITLTNKEILNGNIFTTETAHLRVSMLILQRSTNYK